MLILFTTTDRPTMAEMCTIIGELHDPLIEVLDKVLDALPMPPNELLDALLIIAIYNHAEAKTKAFRYAGFDDTPQSIIVSAQHLIGQISFARLLCCSESRGLFDLLEKYPNILPRFKFELTVVAYGMTLFAAASTNKSTPLELVRQWLEATNLLIRYRENASFQLSCLAEFQHEKVNQAYWLVNDYCNYFFGITNLHHDVRNIRFMHELAKLLYREFDQLAAISVPCDDLPQSYLCRGASFVLI